LRAPQQELVVRAGPRAGAGAFPRRQKGATAAAAAGRIFGARGPWGAAEGKGGTGGVEHRRFFRSGGVGGVASENGFRVLGFRV
jgi:hypothetical protein